MIDFRSSYKFNIQIGYKHVYVVLEHAIEHKEYIYEKDGGEGSVYRDLSRDAYIHGVYKTREGAENKRYKLSKDKKRHRGYLCVLRLPVKGKRLTSGKDND